MPVAGVDHPRISSAHGDGFHPSNIGASKHGPEPIETSALQESAKVRHAAYSSSAPALTTALCAHVDHTFGRALCPVAANRMSRRAVALALGSGRVAGDGAASANQQERGFGDIKLYEYLGDPGWNDTRRRVQRTAPGASLPRDPRIGVARGARGAADGAYVGRLHTRGSGDSGRVVRAARCGEVLEALGPMVAQQARPAEPPIVADSPADASAPGRRADAALDAPQPQANSRTTNLWGFVGFVDTRGRLSAPPGSLEMAGDLDGSTATATATCPF